MEIIMAGQIGRKNRGEERGGYMGEQGATKRARAGHKKELPPEVSALCNDYLKQSVRFAQEFAKLSDLSDKKAPKIENMIVGRCSEAISMARLSALELI
jgi:hypothetical protein